MTHDFSGYRNVLIGTDFSASADAALKQAIWLARHASVDITLAHTLPDLSHAVHSASALAKLNLLQNQGDAFQRERRIAAETQMRRMIADLGAIDLDVRFETLVGEPFVELTRAVQSTGYDLVLAGTRGLAAWEQFMVGSTAKRLVRKCPASVWIVKEEQVTPPKVVLAATDFSVVSAKGVTQGLWVALQANAQFHLLHVIDSMDIPEDVISKVPRASNLRNEINAEAKARLDDLVASLPVDRDKIRIHLSWGTPWKEVSRLAKHVSADVIAMGTVGRSGIQGLLLGNTAEKVLSSCDCSILAVKPDEFVSPIQPPA
jgi:universal stress protein E